MYSIRPSFKNRFTSYTFGVIVNNRPPFKQAFTFDDVLLVPQKSTVLPRDVNLKTRLTKNIGLNIPILSAAMDTVTESDMAIALARTGGMGIIHKNLTIEDQSKMVDRVKRSESGMILNPVTVNVSSTIQDAKKIMSEFRISGLPVVKYDRHVGIITNRDLRFETNDLLQVYGLQEEIGVIAVFGEDTEDLQAVRVSALGVGALEV